MAGGSSRRPEMRHGPEPAARSPRVRVRPGLGGIFQKEGENADGPRHGQAAPSRPSRPRPHTDRGHLRLWGRRGRLGEARDCD